MTDSRVAHGLDEVDAGSSVVTIGVFDGVHRGHQAIIGRAVAAAADSLHRAVAVTFDRHPMEVIEPGSRPPYLQTLERRVATLLDQDIDLVVVLAFTPELAGLSPAAFVDEVLAGALQAHRVVVGDNFRFGRGASGDVERLTVLGDERGFGVDAVPLVREDGTVISSTAIRDRLGAGEVAAAAAALGRPYAVEGTVVEGAGRGRRVGIPTANLRVPDELLIPGRGVYAGTATIVDSDRRHDCVINVGVRPTFSERKLTVEAHLLDAEPELYGRQLSVAFLARLRDERSFEGVDALVAQIHRDIEAAREHLSGANGRVPGLPREQR